MSAPKFTPGPWHADADDDVVSAGGDAIATVYAIDADEQTANAHLIAAAPDLYEALANLRDTFCRQSISAGNSPAFTNGICVEADAALAKARGGASR